MCEEYLLRLFYSLNRFLTCRTRSILLSFISIGVYNQLSVNGIVVGLVFLVSIWPVSILHEVVDDVLLVLGALSGEESLTISRLCHHVENLLLCAAHRVIGKPVQTRV